MLDHYYGTHLACELHTLAVHGRPAVLTLQVYWHVFGNALIFQ